MAKFTLKINGTMKTADVDPETPLLWVLREHLDLAGTKYGCGIAQCGACTVHMDGNPLRSCVMPVSAVGEAEITTIEGLSTDLNHPVQKAWSELDVPQCGYCQAGQMMTAAAFIKENADPTEQEIADAMAGNICRCGSYHRINKAVQRAAELAKN